MLSAYILSPMLLPLLLCSSGTLVLLLLQAPADAAPLGRSLLQGGGKTTKARQDNELRAMVATGDSILLAVRKVSGSSIASSTKDGITLARKAGSGSASPSDFAPGGDDARRRLLQLQRHLAANTYGSSDDSSIAGQASDSGFAGVMQRVTNARKLLQGKTIGANAALSTWSVMSAAEDIQEAALGGAQLKAVLDATQQGNKLSRQVSSRNLDPSAFDKKRTNGR
jgi:hypothetical protein